MLPMEDRGVTRAPVVASPPPPPPKPEEKVVHAQGGDTPGDVARRHGVDEHDLREANPGMPERLSHGEEVHLPANFKPLLEPEATVHTAESGETLNDIANDYDVRLKKVIEANPELAGNGPLKAGVAVNIPKDEKPVASPADLTDRALRNSQRADKTLDEVNQSTNGVGAAVPFLSQQSNEAQGRVKTAAQLEIDATITAKGGDVSDPAAVRQAGDEIIARHAGDPAAQATLEKVVKDIQADHEAARVVQAAGSETDPAKALKAINEPFHTASPEARQKVLNDPKVQQWVKQSADAATAPLSTLGTPSAAEGPQHPSAAAADNLDNATRGLDKELGGAIVGASLPAWEAANKKSQEAGFPLFGPQGTQAMAQVAGRVADSANGQALVTRLAGLQARDINGLTASMREGTSPAYLLELGRLSSRPGEPADGVVDLALQGTKGFAGKVQDDAKEYTEHYQELAWLTKQYGSTMTPDQLNKAVNDYMSGPEGEAWKKKGEQLERKLADDGEKLLNQLTALDKLPPELKGRQGDADKLRDDLLNDPKTGVALQMAMKLKPELTSGQKGVEVLNFFSKVKLGDQGRKLLTEAATRRVQNEVMSKLKDVDPSNPASMDKARKAIDDLKGSKFATAFGVKAADMDKVADSLKNALPKAGETTEQMAERLKQLDKDLNSFTGTQGVKSFDKTTWQGSLLRTVGLGAAAVGFVNSVNKAQKDPKVANDLRVLVDAAGLGQKGSEIALGLGIVSEDSLAGKFGGAAKIGRVGAAEVLGVLGAALDVYNMVDTLRKGEYGAAALWGTGAAGGLLATFGSGALAGPIGIGLVAVSAIGLGLYNHIKDADKYETEKSANFLKHNGLDPAAADELINQSFDGHSPVGLLYAYAHQKGLDNQQATAWLNDLQRKGKLDDVRGEVHHMLDKVDGDLGKIEPGSGDDWQFFQDYRPVYAGKAPPPPPPTSENYAQLDSWMRRHDIPVATA